MSNILSKMNTLISGFEWYLPIVFKDNIAQCKFEQGDVIYKHKPLGLNWGEEKKQIEYLIQVKSPLRGNRLADSGLDAFDSNWTSKIIFEKIYPNNTLLNKTIETTQGKFFTFLWKNDETIFYNNIDISPVITFARLKAVEPKKSEKKIGWINSDFISSKIPYASSGFAMVTDSVNDITIDKKEAIIKILEKELTYDIKTYSCQEAINIDYSQNIINQNFSPTLNVILFLFDSKISNKIQDELKKILYKGDKNRFNISAHGLLINK